MSLDAIEARWRAATPGPWRVGHYGKYFGNATLGVWTEKHGERIANATCKHENSAANAALIAHAPTDIAALLAVAKAARKFVANAVIVPDHSLAVRRDYHELIASLATLEADRG